MSDEIILELKNRDVLGKAVKKLRRAGQVPAVVHNHGKASFHVVGEYNEVARIYQLAGKHRAIDIKLEGKDLTALIKKVDIDPKKNQLRHVVFNAVKKNQKVEAEVPIRPRYDEDNESSPAERAGLVVLANLEAVEIKAVPSQIPEEVTYDAEKLVEVGDKITVADLSIPAGVELVTDPDHAVATVYEPSALAAANEAAAGAAEDVSEVESDHESGATETGQLDEERPGGKKELEDRGQSHNPDKK